MTDKVKTAKRGEEPRQLRRDRYILLSVGQRGKEFQNERGREKREDRERRNLILKKILGMA